MQTSLLCTSPMGRMPPSASGCRLREMKPAPDSTRSGIGLISGWALSDRGVVSVEAFINGVSLGFLPYGSARGDVAAVFPDIPGSTNSGWSMKWAFSISGEGEHTLRVVVTEEGGEWRLCGYK